MDMKVLQGAISQSVAESGKDFFESLYKKAFPVFARFAARSNASLEDAKDIFHDALVIYYEKSDVISLDLKVSAEAYVIGIAKHLWIRKFHADRRQVSLTDLESSITLPPDYYPTVNELRLLSFIENSGKRCLELLRKFYYDKISLREIAASLGYRSEHSAAVQKFKCIGKMRAAVRSKAMDYEDFLQ